jgi:hypothetical protein
MRILRRAAPSWNAPVFTYAGTATRDPFLVLVACILSLRTKDETTGPAAERLFSLGSTPAAVQALTTRQIERAIYPVGFYRTKARTIRRLCADLLARHGGHVPSALDTLLELPGVGRKTANLVVTQAFGRPGIFDRSCLPVTGSRSTDSSLHWGRRSAARFHRSAAPAPYRRTAPALVCAGLGESLSHGPFRRPSSHKAAAMSCSVRVRALGCKEGRQLWLFMAPTSRKRHVCVGSGRGSPRNQVRIVRLRHASTVCRGETSEHEKRCTLRLQQ